MQQADILASMRLFADEVRPAFGAVTRA